MSVTEDAQRVVISHQPARPDGAYGSYVCCGCDDWRGHRDQHPAHVVEALQAAGVLRPEVIDLENLGLSRIEITSSVGRPTHVLIERNGTPIVNGYMESPRAGVLHPRIAAPVPAGQPGPPRGVLWPTARVEQRMLALAADMDRDTPYTATILRGFANEVTYLRAMLDPDGVDDITAMWPDLVHQYAERERRTRMLLANYTPAPGDLDADKVLTELREILGPDTTPTPTERTCPGGC